jgi:hypothetical protein
MKTTGLGVAKRESNNAKILMRKLVVLVFPDEELAISCALGFRSSKFSAPDALPLD